MIEHTRFHTYYKIQEFTERAAKIQPLIKLGWLPSDIFGVALDVFNWYMDKYDELEELPQNYLEMPFSFTPFCEDVPDCKIYLFGNKDFHLVTTGELKDFCKKNRYGYPYKN